MKSHDTPSFGPVPANPTSVEPLEMGFDTFGGSSHKPLTPRTTFLQPGPDFREDLLLREMIEYGDSFGMDIGRLYTEDKPTLLRFLHACNGNIELCFQRVAEHQAWLSEGVSVYSNQPSVQKDVAMFAIEFVGKDRTQHPLLVIHPTKFANLGLERALGVVLFHLHHGIKKLFTPGIAESFTLLINFSTEESRRCIIPYNMYLELLQIIFNYYPNFLHQVLFVSPVSLADLEKVLQKYFGKVLPPSTYKKIRIFETPDFKNQLTQFIDPNSVTEAYRKLFDPKYNIPVFSPQTSFGNQEPIDAPFILNSARSSTPPPPYSSNTFEKVAPYSSNSFDYKNKVIPLSGESARNFHSTKNQLEESIPPKATTTQVLSESFTTAISLPSEPQQQSSFLVGQVPSHQESSTQVQSHQESSTQVQSHQESSTQVPSHRESSSLAPITWASIPREPISRAVSNEVPSSAPVEKPPDYEMPSNKNKKEVVVNTNNSSPLAPDLVTAINPLLAATDFGDDFQSTDPHRKFLNLVSCPKIPGEVYKYSPSESVFGHRHIFAEPFLPTEESHLATYDDFVKRNSYPNADMMADKSQRLRYLQANEFNSKKAYDALKASFMWRQNSLPQALDSLKEHLKLGLAYVFGRDRDMRPILVVNAGACASKKEKIVRSVILFWIEYMIQTCMVPGKVDQIRVIGDLGGITVFNSPSSKFNSSFAKELLDNYPCRLFKISLINASIFQRTSMNWLTSDFPARTKAKITILNSDYFDVLHGEISSCQIQAKFGGREPDPTDFLKPHFPKIRYRRDNFNSTTSSKANEPQFQSIPRLT
eukprot:GHVP01023341.1.p1 GENE.GHVP01023341.1~~GHVP01023341.1.p1  ORF type:complete len:818 (+),score=134.02 GHVP01023341.1:17-2470(+)